MSPLTFYRKYIKTCKALREVSLPNSVDEQEIRIEKTMFPDDWRLYYKKDKHIPCKSELEARYLQVWLKHGLTYIEIPKDEKYLFELMPILEQIDSLVDEKAEEKFAGYKDETIKDLISGLWSEVHDVEEVEYQTKKPKNKK